MTKEPNVMNMPPETNTDFPIGERAHSEILMLYGVVIADIHNAKSTQWAVTNYVLLIYSAIVATYKMTSGAGGSYIKYVHMTVGILILSLGVWIIWQQMMVIKKARERLVKISERFAREVKEIIVLDKNRDKNARSLLLTISLTLIIFVGLIFVCQILSLT